MQKPIFGITTFIVAVFYCVLLLAGNTFIYQQQKQTWFAEFEDAQASELNLLSQLAKDGLIKQNYALVEWIFDQWVGEYQKLVELRLDNQQGFAFIKYNRPVAAEEEMLISSRRINLHDGTYILKMSSDTVELKRRLNELLIQLFLITAGATVLLIIMLWFVLQKFAIQPLQEEIKKYKRIERQLKLLETEN